MIEENLGDIRSQVYLRPPKLRQVVNPPIRYGNYISHKACSSLREGKVCNVGN